MTVAAESTTTTADTIANTVNNIFKELYFCFANYSRVNEANSLTTLLFIYSINNIMNTSCIYLSPLLSPFNDYQGGLLGSGVSKVMSREEVVAAVQHVMTT